MKKGTLLRTLQVFILLFFISSAAKAQVIDSTLAVYGSKYLQERCYLHYDKTAYAAGETIWFKAYLMEGIYAGENSKTLYVDWVDEKGNLLQHTSAPIVEGGVTNGQFDVPENYNGGILHVSAYTKWMLNFDTAFLYKADIRIIPKTVGAIAATVPAIVPSLKFFPEGGDLVAGINNKVAFKAADQWGRPVRIKGLLQKNGVTVDSLKVLHNGMGFFYLKPEAGAKYTAKWRDAKNVERTTELPNVVASGVSMQISILPGKRAFTVNRTGDVPEHLKNLHLVGTMQQNLVFKANVNLTEKLTTSGVIPIQTLPTGVVTITLFDDHWNAIAERITHINNNEYSFPAQLEVKRWGLSKRGRNEIELTVPQDLDANLSVSVTDASIETDSSRNIVSHFMLTSELRGEVYNPSYYFRNTSDTITQQLDLVMLTNGWRRFKWEDVTKGKFPTITYPRDSTYLTLSGKLFGLSPGQLSGSGSVLMMMVKEKDSAAKMMMSPIAADGTFNEPDYLFFDTLKIYYQPSKQLKGASVNFMTARLAALNYKNRNFGDKLFPDTTGFYRHALLAEEAASILKRYKGKMLEAVTVTAKQKPSVQVLDEKYTSGLFKGADAIQFDLVNDPFSGSATDIFMYLQGKVAGLQITPGGSSPSLSWRGGAPLLYLDEIATDPSMISGIPVQDVAYIKVFRPPFMGMSGSYGNGSSGAIAIYTRRGSDATTKPGTGMNSNTAVGYSPIREFYSPNYATFVRANEERDVRTTLYWRPQIITSGKKNKVMLVFYNSDVFSKSLRIVIEGMTKDGQLTHHEEVIE